MSRILLQTVKFARQAAAVTGLIGAAALAFAGQQAGAAGSGGGLASSPPGSGDRMRSFGIQLAFHEDEMTRTLPVGTVRLRVIDRIGGRTLRAPITWRFLTYGRDEAGQRHLLAEARGATPELILPAAWYIVYAHLPDQVIRHPVEVTAGRTFQYTLVKPDSGPRERVTAQGPRLR